MKKHSPKKLALRKNAVAQLGKESLHQVGGDGNTFTCTAYITCALYSKTPDCFISIQDPKTLIKTYKCPTL